MKTEKRPSLEGGKKKGAYIPHSGEEKREKTYALQAETQGKKKKGKGRPREEKLLTRKGRGKGPFKPCPWSDGVKKGSRTIRRPAALCSI